MSKIDKIYQKVTDIILESLEGGVIPWRKTWNETSGNHGLQKNLISKKAYRGCNRWILECVALKKGYKSNQWLTFKQAEKKGGKVNKGEKSTPIVFWTFFEVDKKKGDTIKKETIPMLRYYNVFNLEQTNIELPDTKEKPLPEFTPVENCENVLKSMPLGMPNVQFAEQRAYYSPSLDYINMPLKESFKKPTDYYATLFHELSHSTGHKSRLNRDGVTERHYFGSTNYAKEELVAEMSAAFLCSYTGIDNVTIENTKAYIQSWISKLRKDKTMLVSASGKAQKATDYILNIKE